jgi:nucleoredoxin
MSNISVLEKTHESLTLTWECPSIQIPLFELQMKAPDTDWLILSSNLTSSITKKKNLVANKEYQFRVRYRPKDSTLDSWSEFSSAFSAWVLDSSVKQIAAPREKNKDCSSITIAWDEVPGAEGYRMRYRSDSSTSWTTVDSMIAGTVARKKGLETGVSYFFAIRPVFPSTIASSPDGEIQSTDLSSENSEYAFSPSSAPLQVATLSRHIAQLFPDQLLSKSKGCLVDTADALAGKAIAIYFSAHWCGPCRSYTPRLAEFYIAAQTAGKKFEVVFCSADNSEDEFLSYFHESHPWLAVPFDKKEREALQSLFKVSGIPRLVILGASGRIVNDNAVATPLNITALDSWVAY